MIPPIQSYHVIFFCRSHISFWSSFLLDFKTIFQVKFYLQMMKEMVVRSTKRLKRPQKIPLTSSCRWHLGSVTRMFIVFIRTGTPQHSHAWCEYLSISGKYLHPSPFHPQIWIHEGIFLHLLFANQANTCPSWIVSLPKTIQGGLVNQQSISCVHLSPIRSEEQAVMNVEHCKHCTKLDASW